MNVHGVLRGTKLATARMRERGRGHVVNVASAASKVGPAGRGHLRRHQARRVRLQLAVREELAARGVDLSVVMPAVVDTELAAGTSSAARGRCKPADVGNAVADAIERPHFDVFVPRSLAALARLLALLPERARVGLSRLVVPDR